MPVIHGRFITTKPGRSRWSTKRFATISGLIRAAALTEAGEFRGQTLLMSLLLATARAKTPVARIGRPSDKPRRTFGFRPPFGADATVRA